MTTTANPLTRINVKARGRVHAGARRATYLYGQKIHRPACRGVRATDHEMPREVDEPVNCERCLAAIAARA